TAIEELPHIVQLSGNDHVMVSGGALRPIYFDNVAGGYVPRYYFKEQLANPGFGEFVLTTNTGQQFRLFDFSSALATSQPGQLKSYFDPYGNVTTVTGAGGKPLRMDRSDGTITESLLYGYVLAGVNAGQLASVTLVRQTTGGPVVIVRSVTYVYYTGSEPFGNAGDLKTAVIPHPAGNTLATSHYRHYTPFDGGGYKGGVHYVFGPQAFARLQATYANPFTATNLQVAPYSDMELGYDAVTHAVTKQIVAGAGSSLLDGRGTYTYSYVTSTNPDNINNWKYGTI